MSTQYWLGTRKVSSIRLIRLSQVYLSFREFLPDIADLESVLLLSTYPMTHTA